jgi:hypothetical protein
MPRKTPWRLTPGTRMRLKATRPDAFCAGPQEALQQ